MRSIDASAGRLSLPTNDEGFITANGRIRTPDGSLLEFRVEEGVLEVQDSSGAWITPSYDQGNAIFSEIERRLQPNERLAWVEDRIQLYDPGFGLDPDYVEDCEEEESAPSPAPVARVRKSLRERIFGKPYTIDREHYVPGEGFVLESALTARGHTEPTLNPKVARRSIRRVESAAKAEANVRGFAAVWEDTTVRIPWTQFRLPVPSLDALLSPIPIIGEMVDGAIPMGVFFYNALKARLGPIAIVKGTGLQMANLGLHVLKWTGPAAIVTIPLKAGVDWMFNSVTATTHDFTDRRLKAIEAARALGITEEDIEKVTRESIQRCTEVEEKTANARLVKRWIVRGLVALAAGKLGLSAKDFEGAHPYIEVVLDWFYPLREDRDRAEGDFGKLTRKLAHAYGAHKNKGHGDSHGHGGDSHGHGHGGAHGHGDSHGHGGDSHGHAENHGHADSNGSDHGQADSHGHGADHGHDDHGHATHGHEHTHA